MSNTNRQYYSIAKRKEESSDKFLAKSFNKLSLNKDKPRKKSSTWKKRRKTVDFTRNEELIAENRRNLDEIKRITEENNKLRQENVRLNTKNAEEIQDTRVRNPDYEANRNYYFLLKRREIENRPFEIEQGKYYLIHKKSDTFRSFENEADMNMFVVEFAEEHDDYFVACAGREMRVVQVNCAGEFRPDSDFAFVPMTLSKKMF